MTAGAPGAGVETRSSAFGQLVSRAQIENLPLNGRDFSQLILLQPGTAQGRSDVGDVLTGKGSKVSVHGARTAQNAYMLDGTDILDALGRSAGSAQGQNLLLRRVRGAARAPRADALRAGAEATHKGEPEFILTREQVAAWMADAGFKPVQDIGGLTEGKWFVVYARR